MIDPVRKIGESDSEYQARMRRERSNREAASRKSNLSQQEHDPLNPGNFSSPLNPIHQNIETPRSEPTPSASNTDTSSSSFSSLDNAGSSSFG